MKNRCEGYGTRVGPAQSYNRRCRRSMTLGSPISMLVLGIAISVVGFVLWNAISGAIRDKKEAGAK